MVNVNILSGPVAGSDLSTCFVNLYFVIYGIYNNCKTSGLERVEHNNIIGFRFVTST